MADRMPVMSLMRASITAAGLTGQRAGCRADPPRGAFVSLGGGGPERVAEINFPKGKGRQGLRLGLSFSSVRRPAQCKRWGQGRRGLGFLPAHLAAWSGGKRTHYRKTT